MITPADEDSAFRAAQNDLYRNISVRTQDADNLFPVFSDDFFTPNGLPENTTYFNKLAEYTFNINSLTSYLNNDGLPVPGNLNNLNSLQALNGISPLGDLNAFSNFNGASPDTFLNPFNNYLQTVKESLLNCNLPPLPGAGLLPPPSSLTSLLNINIFDSILKKVSSLPKVGMTIGTDIVKALVTAAQSSLSSLLGPFADYLKVISSCIKKF